jgi:hypothetical protein
MSKKLTIIFILILLILPALAFAQGYGLEETAKEAGLSPNLQTSPEALIGRIVKTALSVLGVIFFGLMLYGGFRWMTARGEAKIVEQAKDIITAAVIGLVIVSAAYAITHFVIKSLTG